MWFLDFFQLSSNQCEAYILMEQNIAFERCVDFLARMIEKYGQELLDEINADEDGGARTKTEDTKSA